MKLKKRKLFVIHIIPVIFALIVSCQEINENKLFPQKKNIVFKELGLEGKIGRVLSMKCINDYLILVERNFSTQIQLIDKKSKMNYLFGKTGQGIGELLQSSDIIPIDDKHIGIYDLQKRTIFNFNIDSIIKLRDDYLPDVLIKEVSPPYQQLFIDRLNDRVYVALGTKNGLKRFVLLDENGEIISMEGNLPEKRDNQISNFTHAFAYWGRLTVNPTESKVAICTNYAGIMQIYDYKMNKVQLIKEHNLFSADYLERDGRFDVISQTRWGYLSISSNDKYIFALYSGKNQVGNPNGEFTRSNIIHVYDWGGNPVIQLLADRNTMVICVDNDFNLYGYDAENGDIVIVDIGNIFTQKQ
jgi:hypothetical protein